MFAIVGAAGKVGYSTSLALRAAGVPVRAILRDGAKAARLQQIGCEIALADVQDTDALARALAGADAVQIILPVALQAQDPAADMRRAIDSLAAALEQARPEQVLAISDYGAHITQDIGMPSLFRTFEARLGQLDARKIMLRSAEHMQNWERVIPVALASGILPTFHDPVDMALPTLSAPDLGPIAAGLLLRPDAGKDLEVVHAEGPRRYGAGDVAAALGQLSGRTIQAHAVPRGQWKEIFERSLPASLAELLIKFSDAQNAGGLVEVAPDGAVRHGTTDLVEALRPLLPPQ